MDAQNAVKCTHNEDKKLAEDGFDPSTSGLWAKYASTAPLCSLTYLRTALFKVKYPNKMPELYQGVLLRSG